MPESWRGQGGSLRPRSGRTSGRPAVGEHSRGLLPRRQFDLLVLDLLVGDHAQQMTDAVDARPLLVVGVDHVPGRLLDVRVGEHVILRAGILHPPFPRLEIHRAEFPPLGRIVDPAAEPAFLLVIADREPVLDEDDAAADEHPLELRAGAEEFAVFFLRAEAHHTFHAGAVIPAAIEQHDFPRRGQLGYVALKVPLRLLALRGSAQGHHATDPRIQALRDPLDDASLPGRIATLEQHDDFQALGPDPLLQPHQLDMHFLELVFVDGVRQFARPAAGCGRGLSCASSPWPAAVSVAVGRPPPVRRCARWNGCDVASGFSDECGKRVARFLPIGSVAPHAEHRVQESPGRADDLRVPQV